MGFGTLFTLDAIAETESATINEIGEDRIWENLNGYWQAHNQLFQQAAEMIAERTTDRLRQYGGTADVIAQELDEFGQPSAQKIGVPGYNIGFPLRRFGNALQWTRFAFEVLTAREFQNQINAMADADEQNMYRSIRRALFTPTNSTFVDWQQMPKLSLPVKALLNADSEAIPNGPYGQTFDGSTHTHYKGVATANTPTAGEARALIENVVEHFTTGMVRLSINKAEETTVRGLTGFKEYLDARLVNQTNAVVATGTLNVSNIYDRAIGLFESAEVWVRPWVPAGYIVADIQGTGIEPPLVLRQPLAQAARNLRLVAEDENYPLRAREWEHRFGFGVYNRAAAAILDVKTGSNTYTAPTL